MKASIIASLAFGAATVSASNYTISTVYTTSVYTVTSCAPTVTDCPGKMGSVTTDIISLYTTLCPVTEAKTSSAPSAPSSTATPYTTSTVKITKEYTITACPPTVTDCPIGSKTSTIITSTTVCPVTETKPAPPPVKTDSSIPPPVKTNSTMPAPPPPATVTLSTIAYSTCVPTTYISVITVTAVPTPSGSGGSGGSGSSSTGGPYVCPGNEKCPAQTTTVLTKSYGTAVPSAPAKNATQTYIPVTGAAAGKQVGGLVAAFGLVLAAFL